MSKRHWTILIVLFLFLICGFYAVFRFFNFTPKSPLLHESAFVSTESFRTEGGVGIVRAVDDTGIRVVLEDGKELVYPLEKITSVYDNRTIGIMKPLDVKFIEIDMKVNVFVSVRASDGSKSVTIILYE